MTILRHTLLAMACLTTSLAPASPLPSLGDSSSAIVSPEQEYVLGRAWLSLLRGQVELLTDPLLKDYVETSVYRLAETSQLEDRRLELVLLDSSQLNAFAAPGGILGINGGLLLHAETEAEYASVLAHELAHLSQRHFARGLEATQRIQIPVMAAMLAGIVATVAGAGDAGMAAITASQGLAYRAQASFSRQNEQEADRIGLLNLARAGYDPRAMPSMFTRLMRLYRYAQQYPEFLMTHPLSDSRVADTRNRADQMPKGGRRDSLRYQLMRVRLQLHFESSPGLAAKQFRSRLNNDAKNDPARYGLALAHIKAGQLSLAQKTLAPLLRRAPNEPIYNLAQVKIDLQSNRLQAAEQRLQKLVRLYPSNYPIQLSRSNLLLKQNHPVQAVEILETLLAQRPRDPHIWYQLAEVRGLAGDRAGVHEARAEYFALNGRYDEAFEQLNYARRRAANFQSAARWDARLKELREEKNMVEELLN